MEMYISEDATVNCLQEAFREAYPCLKLDFYQQPHEAGKGPVAAMRVPPETPIEDIRMQHNFGWINISHQRTAAELEHDFGHEYGLNAQVLRKSGDLWLETTRTDNRTLQQLNEEGKLAEQCIFYYPEEPPVE